MNKVFASALTATIGVGVLSAGSARAQVLDPTLLDIQSRGGQVISVTASSQYAGQDDPTEAFGNPSGPIEPGSFIFADGLGAGTVNTITAILASPATINGLLIQGGAAGPVAGDPRRIAGLEVFVDGSSVASVADFPDTGDGGTGILNLFFSPVSVSTLEIRAVNQDGAGLRLTEVDAYVVPEPATLSLLGMAGLALLGRRRRA